MSKKESDDPAKNKSTKTAIENKPSNSAGQASAEAEANKLNSNRADKTESPAVPAQRVKFPVVGIGASAGGLETLEIFFRHLPEASGMAFVVVTHQHPGHISLLPELLSKMTRIPVTEASEGIKLQADSIYVCPPGEFLEIIDGSLHLVEWVTRELPHLPIDHFLRSLAADQQERAVCIILSGTGTDGTLGLRAIKAESGMAMAQQVQSAKYAGMPSSALSTGLVDYVLPPEAMPEQLIAYSRGSYLAPARTGGVKAIQEEPLKKIFMLLRSRTGHDFTSYKSSTIWRRIERRMNVHQIKDQNQYFRFLQENPHEIDILFKELLISVTSFFRDADAFDILIEQVLPELINSRPDNYTLRIWVPGCATGEEVYSIAICLREVIDRIKRPFEVQIFGTDLDRKAIEYARACHYPEGIAVDVATPRLERYFIREDRGYCVRKDIRDMAIFSVQNVIKDPPFTKLDLLICRNLLIYLNADLQKKVLPLFHYALKPGGILFLGPSETIGSFTGLFEVVDKKWKIFRRQMVSVPNTSLVEFPTDVSKVQPTEQSYLAIRPKRENSQIAVVVEKLLVKRFAPPSVVVNERGDVAYIHGRTGEFLEPAAGQPRLNVLDMAREGLQIELSIALRQAGRQDTEVRQDGVRVRTNGHFKLIDLTVSRLSEPEILRGLYLISFQEQPAIPEKQAAKHGSPLPPHKRESKQLEALERELQCTKESLQTTIEELETSNEELKSTNEELQSTNEELQSTNEELETSKEEMQSLNEELTTVNSELHVKVDDLSRANDDMQNLLNSTDIATIFLDRDLNINRYTEQARQLVKIIPSDIGRPLADLVSNLDYDRLVPECQEVMRTLTVKQSEVLNKDGRWYFMRIMPYRTAENVIDGLVLTFVDINPIKSAELEFESIKKSLQTELELMTRLQEMALMFIQGAKLPVLLDEILDSALYICATDMGSIQIYDSATDSLRIVSHRGFKNAWLNYWDKMPIKKGAYGRAFTDKQRIIVEDVGKSPGFINTPELDIMLKAGIQALQTTPVINRQQRIFGVISTHFKMPHRPNERDCNLLDILARQTAEILEHSDINRLLQKKSGQGE